MKVLIVDDDFYVLKGLKTLIPWEELGAEIIGEAKNGEEAFSIALEKSPDIIISDIKMPIMDGLELCKKIHDAMIDTNFIFLSAYEDFDYALSAMRYGVKNYIIKPIDREKIEKLKQEISSIRQEHDKRLSLYKKLLDESLENEFFKALTTGNQVYLENFFEIELNKEENQCCKNKDFYIRLIEILFNYFKSIGLSPASTFNSKEGAINELYSLKTVDSMASYVEQLYLDVLQFTSQKKDSRADQIVEYVKDLITQKYSDSNLSVSEIADSINLSAAYLSVIFRQLTGVNIISHIKDLRINKACDLLRNPSISISSIATLTGFQNQHYFAKAFKKTKKVTPSEYRNLAFNISSSGEAGL